MEAFRGVVEELCSVKGGGYPRSERKQMGGAMRHSLLVFLFLPSLAAAQTVYKCDAAGRIEYSDKPCVIGNEVKRIAAEGGPTAVDRARAQMRQNSERVGSEAKGRTDQVHLPSPARTLVDQEGNVYLARASAATGSATSSATYVRSDGQICTYDGTRICCKSEGQDGYALASQDQTTD